MHSYQPLLEINLDAITNNWRYIKNKAYGAEVSAVVKADAYGLGAVDIALALENNGCSSFFVATLEEALELTQVLDKNSNIFIFDGFDARFSEDYKRHGFIPVLNSSNQISDWINAVIANRYAVMVDTGMNRLGLSAPEFLYVLDKYSINPEFILSHLACSDLPECSMSLQQLDKFNSVIEKVRNKFSFKTSLSSSSGLFLGESFCKDMVRPGIALYGSRSFTTENVDNIEPVIELSAPIIQLREVNEDGSVGYGASEIVKKGSLLATVRIGYADGIWRRLQGRMKGYIHGIVVPLVGRISMDYCVFDISELKKYGSNLSVTVGDYISIINKRQTIDDIAVMADTIPYEVLTSLGKRCHRIYSSAVVKDSL